LITIGFILLVPIVSPNLGFLHGPLMGAGFVAGTAAYAVFVLQDGVLTGLRRPGWVLLENSVFGAAKIIFAGLFALAGMAAGILYSWFAGLVIALGLTNFYLFTRAIPRTARERRDGVSGQGTPNLGYIASDYAGALCWLAATN